MRIKTKADCKLAISLYPMFAYNAVGGGGWGTVEQLPEGKLFLRFDPMGATPLVIPDLSFRNTSMFGIPMPPPLNIEIKPRIFEVRWEGGRAGLTAGQGRRRPGAV